MHSAFTIDSSTPTSTPNLKKHPLLNKTTPQMFYTVFTYTYVYRVFHNSRAREKEETRDRIWMCNFEEKKSSFKYIREKTT
jgi:hypothetical protein